MRSLSLLAAALLIAASADAAPDLGREVTPAEVAAWELTVTPDGRGLPSGSGTVALGRAVYKSKCAGCHGETGTEGPADRLAGGLGTLTAQKPIKTVGSYWPYATTLFDYIRRAMPYDAPRSLTADEVYALCAFLLFRNGIVAPEAMLNTTTLPQVQMPNRDGFVAERLP